MEEPNGESWTGFQSLHSDRGYFIIYRENSNKVTEELETFLDDGVTVQIKSLTDMSYSTIQIAGKSGRISFSLPEKNCFDIYEYIIIKGV